MKVLWMQMKRMVIVCCMSLLFLAQHEHVYAMKRQQNEGLIVHFINVGQGDSILIETPEGKTMLIDGGPPKAGKPLVDYLREKQIEFIDVIVATHPDFDHIGGLTDVMETFPVGQIIETGKFHLTKTYTTYAATIFLKQIPVRIANKGDFIQIDSNLKIELLNSSSEKKENNPSSIAIKMTYDEVDFLLMADVEKAQEKQMIDEADISADIIKIAHHGSKTSSSRTFLQHVDPDIAILTYSKENDFGHPANRVIHDLQTLSSFIYSTAVFGNIVIESDGKDYIILPEKSPFDALVE